METQQMEHSVFLRKWNSQIRIQNSWCFPTPMMRSLRQPNFKYALTEVMYKDKLLINLVFFAALMFVTCSQMKSKTGVFASSCDEREL